MWAYVGQDMQKNCKEIKVVLSEYMGWKKNYQRAKMNSKINEQKFQKTP